MTQDQLDVQVARNDEKSRYEARIDGSVAGFAAYRNEGDAVVFTHTEVQPRWEGLGVASRLVAGALDDVVAAGHRIVPDCQFVAEYVDEHPTYADHVARR